MSSNLLKLLLGSKTRLKLLRVFLWNKSNEFYLRELQALIMEDLTAIRREVAKMHEEKLLSKVERGNRIYYQINESHPFTTPLFELFTESEYMHGRLFRLINDKESFEESFNNVLLYGNSSAMLDNSSWNLLFVGNLSSERVKNLVDSIEKTLNKNVFYRCYPKSEYDLMIENDSPILDEIFLGEMLEIKRNGIYL
jgi:hypothetical protein